jgi:outer membrane protein assembly factor BamB
MMLQVSVDGKCYALDLDSGRLRWSYDAESAVAGVYYVGEAGGGKERAHIGHLTKLPHLPFNWDLLRAFKQQKWGLVGSDGEEEEREACGGSEHPDCDDALVMRSLLSLLRAGPSKRDGTQHIYFDRTDEGVFYALPTRALPVPTTATTTTNNNNPSNTFVVPPSSALVTKPKKRAERGVTGVVTGNLLSLSWNPLVPLL